MCSDVARLGELVAAAERITVLTGAGISTDSGIPDFRGPQGLWTKDPEAEKRATLQHYLGDPEVRRGAWRFRRDSAGWAAQPNAGHLALVELERMGKLHALVTQNIDGLHQRAGNDAALVIEVHGTMWWTRCWTCGDRRPMTEALERVADGEDDPDCLACRGASSSDEWQRDRAASFRGEGPVRHEAPPGASRAERMRGGILKSDTISFGQALVPEVIERSLTASETCDLLLAVGSSLSVYPAANCVPRAVAAGAEVAIVNGEPTALDRMADVVVLGSISEVLPAAVAAARSVARGA